MCNVMTEIFKIFSRLYLRNCKVEEVKGCKCWLRALGVQCHGVTLI